MGGNFEGRGLEEVYKCNLDIFNVNESWKGGGASYQILHVEQTFPPPTLIRKFSTIDLKSL